MSYTQKHFVVEFFSSEYVHFSRKYFVFCINDNFFSVSVYKFRGFYLTIKVFLCHSQVFLCHKQIKYGLDIFKLDLMISMESKVSGKNHFFLL